MLFAVHFALYGAQSRVVVVLSTASQRWSQNVSSSRTIVGWTDGIIVTGVYKGSVWILTRLEGDSREILQPVARVGFGAHDGDFAQCVLLYDVGRRVVSGPKLYMEQCGGDPCFGE